VLRLLRLLGPYVVWLYPIGVLILLVYLRAWLLAGRDLRASLFSLEREVAVARMRRAAGGAFTTFGLLVILFFGQFYLGRSINWADIIRPTPTPDFLPTSLFVPTPGPGTPTTPGPEVTPSPTSTRRPTPRPVTLIPSPTAMPMVTETPTPPPPPADCSDPNVQILQPTDGAQIQGRVDIRGTASIPGFQFYKIELGLGEQPTRWSSIADVHRNPVTNGLLEVWDTTDLPAGSYTVRLVVVDATGNFPPPCEVRVFVTH
jgi:hypothetical protein